MKKIKLTISIVSIIFFNALSIKAQKPLNKDLIDSTIVKIGKLMLDYYIIKDKGEEANKTLTNNLKQKKYYSLDGGELASTLIDDLQSITKDKHLMIKFYPEGDAASDYLAERENIDEDFKPSEVSLKRSRMHNYGFEEVSILDMNIGYLKLNGFYDIRNPETTKTAAAAMEFLTHTNGIIIDLSDNSGGDPATLQFLISYFFKVEPPTHYNTFHFRDGADKYIEKYTLPYIPGKRLWNTPLYIITSQKTYSAGEALAYALKELDRATIVGQTTGGGAHAADFKLINDYFDMSIPIARAINPISKTNWEGVGVKPDVEMELEKAKDYAQIEIIKILMQQETDEVFLAKYKWKLEDLECAFNKFKYATNDLNKFVGKFDGNRRIFVENGQLKYQKGAGEIANLTPLNKTSFKSNTFSDIRIHFDFDHEILIGLMFYMESGQFYVAKKLE